MNIQGTQDRNEVSSARVAERPLHQFSFADCELAGSGIYVCMFAGTGPMHAETAEG